MILPADYLLQALRVLAGSPNGCSETLLAARGVSVTTMVALVKSGRSSTTVDRIRAGARQIEVATLRITDAGREAIG